METVVDPSTQQLVRYQALFREVNERLKEISSTLSFMEFICECGHEDCTKTLAVAGHEYDAVRANPTHFLLAPGHEITEVERVVEDNDRFVVVETTVETAFMAESDPRTSGAV